MLDTLGAKLFIKMENGFRIGVAAENMSVFLQVAAQLLIIVDFAIKDDPDRLVFVGNGLLSAFQIDNGESPRGQPGSVRQVKSILIRAPVSDGLVHPFKDLSRD